MAEPIKIMRELPTICFLTLEQSGIEKDDAEAIKSWIEKRILFACETVWHDAISHILPKIALEPPKEMSEGSDIHFNYEHRGVKFAVTADWHCLDLRVKVWAWFDVGGLGYGKRSD